MQIIAERAYPFLTFVLLASIPILLSTGVEQSDAKGTTTQSKPKAPSKPYTKQQSCHPNKLVPTANKKGTDSRADFVFNAAFTGGVMVGAGGLSVDMSRLNNDSSADLIEIAPANSNTVKSTCR